MKAILGISGDGTWKFFRTMVLRRLGAPGIITNRCGMKRYPSEHIATIRWEKCELVREQRLTIKLDAKTLPPFGSLGIAGIGGPHVGANSIWPMSLMVQAWTAVDEHEVSRLLQQLMVTSDPNSLMHESFNKDTLSSYTRPWFAWANTLFGDLVLKIASDQVLYRAINLKKPLDLVKLVKRWNHEREIVVV